MKAWVIYIYIIIWMLTGLAALIYGTMLNKIDGQFTTTVSNIGSAWLATAISSGYAYFGLNPPAQEDDSGTGSGTGSGTVSGNGNSSGSGDS